MNWRHLFQGRRGRQLWYVPILSSAMALLMLRVLVLARVLEIEAFSQFNVGLLLSTTFCMLGCLGVQSILQRDMPVMFVHRRCRAAMVLLMQALLIAGACAALAMAFCIPGFTAIAFSPALTAVGILHGLSQQAFLLATVESRSRGDPLHFARQNLWRACALVVAGCGVAYWTQSALHVLAVEAVLSLVFAGGIVRRTCRHTGLGMTGLATIAFRRLPRLPWETAMVLFLVSMMGFVLMNTDRWVAVHLLSERSFGLYAFSAILLTAAQSSQSMINASVYPMLARQNAAHGVGRAYDICKQLSIALIASSLLLSIPAFFVFAAVIDRWYPDYQPAISALPLFLLAAAFRVSDFWSSLMMICGLEGNLLKLNVGIYVLSMALWAAIMASGSLQLRPVALCASLSAILSVGIFVGAFANCRVAVRAMQRRSS